MFMQTAIVMSQIDNEYPMIEAVYDLLRKTLIRKDKDIYTRPQANRINTNTVNAVCLKN